MARRVEKDNVEIIYGCCLCDLFLKTKEQKEKEANNSDKNVENAQQQNGEQTIQVEPSV